MTLRTREDVLTRQGESRFSQEPARELDGLLEETLGQLRHDLLEASFDPDTGHAQRLELIRDIAARLQRSRRHHHV